MRSTGILCQGSFNPLGVVPAVGPGQFEPGEAYVVEDQPGPTYRGISPTGGTSITAAANTLASKLSRRGQGLGD
jgi:hypothetical protein